MSVLLKEERQQRILEALQKERRVQVSELSRYFGISEVTIRRDLAELAASGQIIRAHRGALVAVPALPEPPVVHRMSVAQAEKEAIARSAAALVREGDSIFIGSGSTMTCFARCLAGIQKLTAITNALNIATVMAAQDSRPTVVVVGGVLRSEELSLLGHIAEQTLSEVRVNRVFMGVQALSLEDGWTTDYLPEVTTTRKILDMAAELVVLADHSKFGQTAAAFIAPVTRISHLLTDTRADPAFLARMQALGVRITIAGKG